MVDIDEKDFENPQLCAEYTQDMYAYLRLVKNVKIICVIVSFFTFRSVEPFSAVKANHLIGCSINEKVGSNSFVIVW